MRQADLDHVSGSLAAELAAARSSSVLFAEGSGRPGGARVRARQTDCNSKTLYPNRSFDARARSKSRERRDTGSSCEDLIAGRAMRTDELMAVITWCVAVLTLGNFGFGIALRLMQ